MGWGIWEPGVVLCAAFGSSQCPQTCCKFSLLLVRKFLIWQNSVLVEDLPFLTLFLYSLDSPVVLGCDIHVVEPLFPSPHQFTLWYWWGLTNYSEIRVL